MRNIVDKIVARGAEALEDGELLALLLMEGTADERAKAMAEELLTGDVNSLQSLAGCDLSRLRMLAGMGRSRALRLKAAAEFGRRVARSELSKADTIASDGDVVRIMSPLLGNLQYEECWVIYLASSGRVLDSVRISQGGVQATVVDCRLIFKRALELLAVQIVLVHNHPSGSPMPSDSDKELTQRVARAAELFDIRLLDHVIIGRGTHFSFRGEAMLR